MNGVAMAERKKPSESEDRMSTLNVRASVRLLVGKIAAHRGLTINEFFEEPDVQTFFRHLLVVEMEKEMGKEGKPQRHRT